MTAAELFVRCLENEDVDYVFGMCVGCHGVAGLDGRGPRLVKREAAPDANPWALGRILPIRSPYATTVWDYINRGMPLNDEGILTADGGNAKS